MTHMSPRGFFVTGTDTGVGKTVVCGALIRAHQTRGLSVGVMKPVESGCDERDGRPVPADAGFLRSVSGSSVAPELVCPYPLREPLAPALAAEHDGIAIDLAAIQRCYQQIAQQHDVVVVEGVGGILAPLDSEHTMLDLVSSLELPVLIVAANTLGVINHTALTVHAIRHRGVPLVGVILNTLRPEQDAAKRTNAAALRRWAGAPLLADLLYLPAITEQSLQELAELLHVEDWA
jgi:dethiobiotin synthetase